MLVYLFVKKGDNHELHGIEMNELPQEFVAEQTKLTNAGYVLSNSSDYEFQLLNGAKAGMVEQAKLDEANAKIAELEEKIKVLDPKE